MCLIILVERLKGKQFFLRSVLILPSHPCLGHPSNLSPTGVSD